MIYHPMLPWAYTTVRYIWELSSCYILEWKQNGYTCSSICRSVMECFIGTSLAVGKSTFKVSFFKLYLFYNDYDVCVQMVFMWEETGVPEGNPPVWLGALMTISHAYAGYRIRVAAVRGKCVNTAPARQP